MSEEEVQSRIFDILGTRPTPGESTGEAIAAADSAGEAIAAATCKAAAPDTWLYFNFYFSNGVGEGLTRGCLSYSIQYQKDICFILVIK